MKKEDICVGEYYTLTNPTNKKVECIKAKCLAITEDRLTFQGTLESGKLHTFTTDLQSLVVTAYVSNKEKRELNNMSMIGRFFYNLFSKRK